MQFQQLTHNMLTVLNTEYEKEDLNKTIITKFHQLDNTQRQIIINIENKYKILVDGTLGTH